MSKAIAFLFVTSISMLVVLCQTSQPPIPRNAIKLLAETNEVGTCLQWWVSADYVKTLPVWHPEPGHLERPPLSIGEAIQIARRTGNEKEPLQSVAVMPIDERYFMRWTDVHYYICKFQTSKEKHRTVVVMMDGTVLQPSKEVKK